MMGIRPFPTTAHHSMSIGGTEPVNHTMAQILSIVVNKRHDDLDEQVFHVESSYRNSLRSRIGLAPNKIYHECLLCLPLTVLERRGVSRQQRFKDDEL